MKTNFSWTIFAFLSIVLSQSVFAQNECADLSAQEMFRIKVETTTLIACAEAKEGLVSDLTIIGVRKDVAEHLFDGDAAFKVYKVEKEKNGLVVHESLNSHRDQPTFRIAISCTSKECKKQERCAWKTVSSNDVFIKSFKKNVSKLTVADWERAFFAALNGSVPAKSLFESAESSQNASGGEDLETFKHDLTRAALAKCF